MKRLVAGLVGTMLLFAPIRFLYVTMVPLPTYRTGTFDDGVYKGHGRQSLAARRERKLLHEKIFDPGFSVLL